jgi:hypothetical protein
VVQFLAKERDIFFSDASRPALGATQPPAHWILGALYAAVKLAIHLQLVPMLRITGFISPLPHMPSWRAYVQLHLYEPNL